MSVVAVLVDCDGMNVWDVLTNWIYDMVTRPGEMLKNYDRVLAFPEKTIQVRQIIYYKKMLNTVFIKNFIKQSLSVLIKIR